MENIYRSDTGRYKASDFAPELRYPTQVIDPYTSREMTLYGQVPITEGLTVSVINNNESHGDDRVGVFTSRDGRYTLAMVNDGITGKLASGAGGQVAHDFLLFAEKYFFSNESALQVNDPRQFLADVIVGGSDFIADKYAWIKEAYSTSTLALIETLSDNKKILHLAYVGDSPGYLVKNKKEIIPLVDGGRDTVVQDTLKVAIGDRKLSSEQTIHSYNLDEGDFVILTSDGITVSDYQRDHTLGTVAIEVNRGGTALEIANRIFKKANKVDDKSIIVISCEDNNSPDVIHKTFGNLIDLAGQSNPEEIIRMIESIQDLEYRALFIHNLVFNERIYSSVLKKLDLQNPAIWGYGADFINGVKRKKNTIVESNLIPYLVSSVKTLEELNRVLMALGNIYSNGKDGKTNDITESQFEKLHYLMEGYTHNYDGKILTDFLTRKYGIRDKALEILNAPSGAKKYMNAFGGLLKKAISNFSFEDYYSSEARMRKYEKAKRG